MAGIGPLNDDDPRQVGEYRLTRRLGRGGQGVVYLAESADGTEVAVKMLHADALNLAGLRRQLADEVATARRVARFCTAQVLDADIDAEPPYVVSEYVEGPSLRDLVRRDGPLRGAALERLAVGTITALAAIHQAGIVHRDFKPANVLMAADGPRVIDFGIARVLEGTAILTSSITGTPSYMAPEQITGGPLGPAVDMFAWGATIVHAATGSGPFGHGSLREVVNRVVNEPPELGDLDGPLREIVTRCLSKEAAQRPGAAETLLRVLGVTGGASDAAETSGAEAATGDLPVQTLRAGAIAAAGAPTEPPSAPGAPRPGAHRAPEPAANGGTGPGRPIRAGTAPGPLSGPQAPPGSATGPRTPPPGGFGSNVRISSGPGGAFFTGGPDPGGASGTAPPRVPGPPYLAPRPAPAPAAPPPVGPGGAGAPPFAAGGYPPPGPVAPPPGPVPPAPRRQQGINVLLLAAVLGGVLLVAVAGLVVVVLLLSQVSA
ncbi:serine/threonine-protein kinase [Marinactinospora rubrisoli]|uniref:Protein kinase n=1 Tax=Marinactinospora rubrisoli TaxID=2715399 RepID=A0ABW2KET7_9ACTN